MQNYIQRGEALDVPAPAGGVVSGQVIAFGKLVGIAGFSAPQGTSFALWLKGVYSVPKVAAQAWAIGDEIFWDAVDGVATNVTGNGFMPMGMASAAAANPSADGTVLLARLSS